MTDQGPYRFYKPGDMKGRRTRWIWIGIGLVVVIFIVWLIAPHGDPASTGPGGGPPGAGGRGAAAGGAGGGRGGGRRGGGAPTTVGWARAVSGDAPIYIYALGTATPAQTVTVRTQISGQLLSVGFKEGQIVKKGQLLAQIDPRPYEQALLQAQGNLARDQASLANARIDLQRYDTLVAQDSVAKQTRDTQAALVRQLEGTVKADQGSVGAARVNLVYCHITSPVNGRVGLRQVDPGNYVTPGDTNGLVVVTEVTPIDVLFTVPEDNLAQVNKRVTSGAVLEAAAFDRTQKVQLALGKLLTLDNQVDTTTGTVRAKARYDNSDGALFPNQFVNVRLLVDTIHGTVLIPTSAILRGSNGLFVWVYDPTARTVEQRTVQTGPAAGENTAVTSGLDPSEIVVTDGSDRLRDGQRVFLQNDCLTAAQMKRMQAFAAGGAAGAGSGPRGAASGNPAVGAPPPATAAQPKTVFNLFGLLGSKPKAQISPYGAMACKPGQLSVADGGGGNGSSTVQATPAATTNAPGSAPAPGAHHQRGDAPPTSGAPARPGAPSGNIQTNTAAQTQAAPAAGQSAGQAGGGHMSARLQAMFAPLNLDPAQQAKIQTITDASRPKMMAAFQSGDMAGAKAARTAMDAQIDAVLRPDQKAKMAEIRAQMQARRAAGGGGQ